MEPKAKPIFGFREDLDVTDYKVLISPRFVAHATQFITMIDRALNMLGPSDEMLSDILMDMGAKHARYGVKAEYFPTMGKALVSVVGASLGEDVFTMEVQESWIEVYNALSHDMIKGLSEVYTVEPIGIKEKEPQHQVDSRVWA